MKHKITILRIIRTSMAEDLQEAKQIYDKAFNNYELKQLVYDAIKEIKVKIGEINLQIHNTNMSYYGIDGTLSLINSLELKEILKLQCDKELLVLYRDKDRLNNIIIEAYEILGDL